MDKLVTYCSDSDDDNCDKDNNCGTNAIELEDNKTSISRRPQMKCFDAEHTRVCSKEQTGADGFSFFGFTDTNKKMVFDETELGNGEEKQKIIQVHGNSVEVPEGDFWSNFSEADIPDGLENDSGIAQKRKFESPIGPSKCFAKTSTSENTGFRKDEQSDPLSKTNHEYYGINSHSQTNSHSDVEADLKTVPVKATHSQANSTVKVYTVHPKISPHLNRLQSNQCASKESQRWAGHAGVINRISWCSSPSFSHLILSASMDSTVHVWNAWGQQQRCVRTLTTHTKAVRDSQWSGDGRQVLSCSFDRTAAITDVQTGQCQVRFEHSGYVSAGKFHPVMPYLVTTGTNDCIQVWDTRHPEVPIRILTHKEQLGQIQDLMFSQDGQELFSCGDVVTRESSDRSILAWDFRTGVILSNQIFQERYTVTRLCLHPSHSQFLAQTQAGYIAVFSTQRPYKMNRSKRFEGHKSSGYNIGLAVSADGSLVYSGSSNGKIYCYNFGNGKTIRALNSGEVLLDVAAHPVLPSVVAGATWDGDIVLFH